MPLNSPYISRPNAEALLAALEESFQSPETAQLVFHVWGIGGVGKSTLTQKASEAHRERSGCIASVSFGFTEGVDDPMGLMKTLYAQLVPPDRGWSGDPFWDLYERYWETMERLRTQVSSGRGEVGEEQLKWVKQLAKAGTSLVTNYMQLEEENRKQAQNFVSEAVDSAAALLSLKDHLQRHRATKGDWQLQDLMLQPLPKLTQAFAEGLRRCAETAPVLLTFDTYEKVSTDLDTWLWRSLLGNTDLRSAAVRVVVAGRYDLLKTEGWRKLHQDYQCVYRQGIERFDRVQTQHYLEAIGITDESRIQEIYTITKGLPYYLNWLREEREQGREPDFSQGNEAIVNLLLQGLNETQKRIIQYAACCRSFDRVLIQKLMEHHGLDFATAADEERNCYGWLVERTFVELVQGRQRLDDVARDVFRQALLQDDPEAFRETHQFLADYCKAKSDAEVPPDATYPARYNNPDWRRWRADYLYHLFPSRAPESQHQFRTHLFEARHFGQDDLVRVPLNAIAAEFDLAEHPFLSYADRTFLQQIQPAVQRGWAVLEEDPIDYPYNLENYGLSKQATDTAIRICLKPLEPLTGLAKFSALFFQSRRCPENDRFDWLQQAQAQAETLITSADPDFSGGLFLWNIGLALAALGRKEEAIAAYDKALEIKPDYHEAWNNRGTALSDLGRHEEAIAAYDKAIELKPDYDAAWYNRGTALSALGRHEEAIAAYDKALEFKPDLHEAWLNRGNALSALGRHEEAIAAYDKALDIKPNYHEAWTARGVALETLKHYEEAIVSHDQALKVKPDYDLAWYNRGVSLSALGRHEEAIAAYDKAIEIKPDDDAAWYNRGIALDDLVRHEEALASYEKVLEIKPDDDAAWIRWGNALSDLGRKEEALASYEKVLEIKPDDDTAWGSRGLALDILGRKEEAIESYRRALALDSESIADWFNLGTTFFDLGQTQDAIESFEQAMKIEPNSARAIYVKACYNIMLQNVDNAFEYFRQAFQLEPTLREFVRTDLQLFDDIREDERFRQLFGKN